jgi:hypothetical protein
MTKVPDLDLHGVKHEDAMMIVEEWSVLWDYRVPAFTGKIITGNSQRMRVLAEMALRKNKFDYRLLNENVIIVVGKYK